ncbi:PPC domain-containing DNA-binding protein [[Eubacterium] cellulosolvens]
MDPKYFDSIDLSNVLVVRLKPKDEIREKIEEVMKHNGLKKAVILSAIGSVFEATFFGVKKDSGLPFGKDKITVIKQTGPFEVLTLEGNILPAGDQLISHIHIALGGHDGSILGGHLDRAIVYTTLELFLAEIRNSKVEKEPDKIAGGIQIRLPISS